MSLAQLVEVTVEQGVLRGQRVPPQDDHGLPYDAFRGVPYAQKPVGPLRFKAPRPPEPWEGARPALDEGPIPPQEDLFHKGKVAGKDDCLYLNVYTPQVPTSVASRSPEYRPGAPWPIMVWLYPGGFENGSGSATFYGPDLLVAKNVVVVSVNYRVGALGFLSLESSAATGNYGLKDIVAALRWVKQNGGVFGGDVNQITVFGCSAGAAAVQLLRMSPSAQGLFHRGIAQSGSSLNPWAWVSKPRERALLLARELGASERDLADDNSILEFLRSQPPHAIVEATNQMKKSGGFGTGLILMFLPTSEDGLTPDDPEDEIFLPGHPRDLIKQGRVADIPLITGVNDAEGLLAALGNTNISEATIRPVPEVFAKYDQHLEIALPTELHKVFPDGSQKQKEALERLRKVYFNGGTISEATVNSYYNLQSDLLFVNGVLQEARASAKQSSCPVYVYSFGVKGKINRLMNLIGIKPDEAPGACHGDELSYLFTTGPPIPPTPKFDPTDLEAQTRHRMVTMWTNFAKTGNPTPEGETTLDGVRWPAVPKDVHSSVPYLDIGVALSVPRAGIFKERVELWDSLYAELN